VASVLYDVKVKLVPTIIAATPNKNEEGNKNGR
jgi:hypothetical protein